MITDKRLQYIRSIGDIDFYMFRPTLFHYFFKPMAYYERLFSRKVRETLDFLRGGYFLVYLAEDDRLIGYGTVVKGGGRYRFCTSKDRILCNIFIKEDERGKGYSNILVEYMSHCHPTVYAFIRHNNAPSIRCFTNAGFLKVGNAAHVYGHFIMKSPRGTLGIYYKENKNE